MAYSELREDHGTWKLYAGFPDHDDEPEGTPEIEIDGSTMSGTFVDVFLARYRGESEDDVRAKYAAYVESGLRLWKEHGEAGS